MFSSCIQLSFTVLPERIVMALEVFDKAVCNDVADCCLMQ